MRYLVLPACLSLASLVSSTQLFRHEISYSIGWEAGEQACQTGTTGDQSEAFLAAAREILRRQPDVASIDKHSLRQGLRDSQMACQV